MNNNITEQTPIEQLDATYKKCSQCGAELKGPYKFCPKFMIILDYYLQE